MDAQVKHIVYPVSDITASKALFTKLLGVEPYIDSPYYVGFKAGDVEIGLDPNGHKHGLTPYFQVSDINAASKTLTESGAQILQEPKDVGGGMMVAFLKDKDGNVIGLRQNPA